MLIEGKSEEPLPEKQQIDTDIKKRRLLTIIYALFFGTITAVIVTYALSFFIPEFYTGWAGGLVCPGRVEYLSFKQSYYCFTAANSSFDIDDQMFWAVFKRLIFPVVPVCVILTWGFIKLAEFLYQRRAAAGF